MRQLVFRLGIVTMLSFLAFIPSPAAAGPDGCTVNEEACEACCQAARDACIEHGGYVVEGCYYTTSPKACAKPGCLG